MTIPQEQQLTTARLCRIFDNTVATYKFYWFISILDLYVKRGQTRIHIWDIMVEMVVNAWYPVCYFHLSFGKSESLYDAIMKLQREYGLPFNIKNDDLRAWLNEHKDDRSVASLLNFLPLNVPFRFLRPWIDSNDNREVVRRSQSLENDCPYRLIKEGRMMWIELNEKWLDYFEKNYTILKDFAFWNLTLFLQTRNPNVPNIPNKLIRNETRNPLHLQHQYWDYVMEHGVAINCIYTGRRLSKGDYDLDHFIPWSFVSHDLIWNLLPSDGSINSSKSDKLPKLDIYLPKLAVIQQDAVRTIISNGYNPKLLEDYLSLGCTPQELANMEGEKLVECFMRTYAPMNQIALNMGFETWNY